MDDYARESVERYPRRSIGSSPISRSFHESSSKLTVAQLEARVDDDDGALQHINVVGVHDSKLSAINIRAYDEATMHPAALEFSEVSNPDVIREICHSKIPGWSAAPLDSVHIKQVTEGLTNQIFKVYLQPTQHIALECVLFRIYGTESKEFIDPEVELFIFKMLAKYEIAPKLIILGKGWRVEEWHFALPLPTRVLLNPSIYCQVASQLGRFHKLSSRPDFPHASLLNRGPCVLNWLKDWAQSAQKVKMHTKEWEWRLTAMVEEANWLHEYISKRMKGSIVSGRGWDVVFCHNDCQENNLLQTQYGLRLIDFEYAHFNFQAYDIANFFNEFPIDYIVNTHPFFSLDVTRYPSLGDQRLFVSVYLSEYLKMPVLPTDHSMTDPLIEAIEIFSMASNLVWGLWSILRSPQAFTFDDFDFMAHGAYRFDMFKRTQRRLQTNTSIVSTTHGLAPITLPPAPQILERDVFGGEWKWVIAGIVIGCVVTTELARLLRR